MKPDDDICYCFHVSLRKLVNFARREQPARPSQMSDCLNAGTGCGWCIPILKMIHSRTADGAELREDEDMEGLPKTASEYEAARRSYLKSDQKNQFNE
ncbi:MAG: (2Fe-2S)-binding protein [Phycisphaerae bacterium]|nr:(2Fe-2S)-binding protein [Phycisphaerae bacterium]